MSTLPFSVWQVPVYLPYLQPALTDEAVAAAEEKIGHKLPEAYLALLREQNGGYIRYTLPESVHSLIHGIGPNFPSLTGFDWEEVREVVSYELEGLVPFDGDGHWQLCLDYRGGRIAPAVTLADIECDREELVADSFEAYLALLQYEEGLEGELVLLGISDLGVTLGEISARLGVKFGEPDFFQAGYAIHRASGTAAAGPPQWLSLSPNRAPRGFVREGDPRDEELKDLLPGEALRYPELPDSSYLLSVTEGLRPRVLQACADLAIEVRPLTSYLAGRSELS